MGRIQRFGWFLMGIPVGYRKPIVPLMRWGPYRLGYILANWR